MNDQAFCEKPTLIQRIRLFSLEEFLFKVLSDEWCGNESVPLNHKTLYVPEGDSKYVFSFLNDSFEIGIGWPNKWHGIYRREVIRKFVFWYLFQWSICEWFGLRRWLWYKLLHRRVESYKKFGKQ